MNKTIGMTAAFLLGAAAGAASVWYVLRERYAQIAQEEIDSVKAAFSRMTKQREDDAPKATEHEESAEEPKRATEIAQQSRNLAEKLDYTVYSSKPDISELAKMVKEDEVQDSHPYLIDPSDFGMFSDYEQIELTFFKDNILADDDLEIIENVEEIVGFESLAHFGDHEGDSICVRNNRLKCDYEVVLDERTYQEAREEDRPYRRGVL